MKKEKNVQGKNYILSSHYHRENTYYLRRDVFLPHNCILFFGDSHIQGLCTQAVGENCINYGIGGDTSIGLLHRLAQYHSIHSACAFVIQVGINDFKHISSEETIANFEKMIHLLPKDKRIIIHSIFPVQEHFAQSIAKNIDIQRVNEKLDKLCSLHSNCTFLNMYNFLIDKTGNLSPDYCLSDGIHLNNTGYRIWLDEIKTQMQLLNLLPN